MDLGFLTLNPPDGNPLGSRHADATSPEKLPSPLLVTAPVVARRSHAAASGGLLLLRSVVARQVDLMDALHVHQQSASAVASPPLAMYLETLSMVSRVGRM